MSITVFPIQEALTALDTDPSKFLGAEKKKEDKVYKGTRFLNAHVNVGGNVKKEPWFSFECEPETFIELKGVANPEDVNDKRNEFEGTRLQLETTLSKSGLLGQFIAKLDPVWKNLVAN